MDRGWPCLTLLLLAACSSSPAALDTRPSDLALTELGPDRGAPDQRRDLLPDGPRPPGTWKTVPGASLKLEDHTVTTLPNGDVLIVGGMTDDGTGTGVYSYHSKAYRFLADQGTLIEAGELKEARAGHRAVLLADGRVLILGGENPQTYFISSIEIYDPAKPAASAWSSGPAMLESLADFDAVRLASGEVMVSGGRMDDQDSVPMVTFYLPSSASWKVTLAALGEKRRSHSSILLKSGKLLITGGLQGPTKVGLGTYLASMEIYDPTSGVFSPLTKTMSRQRTGHSMHFVDGDRILILGGYCGNKCTGTSTHDLYDPATDMITPVPHAGLYPSTVAAVQLLDGRVLVLGNNVTSSSVALFVPGGGASGIWGTVPQTQQPRFYTRAALLKDGSVLVVGGRLDKNITYADSLERFTP